MLEENKLSAYFASFCSLTAISSIRFGAVLSGQRFFGCEGHSERHKMVEYTLMVSPTIVLSKITVRCFVKLFCLSRKFGCCLVMLKRCSVRECLDPADSRVLLLDLFAAKFHVHSASDSTIKAAWTRGALNVLSISLLEAFSSQASNAEIIKLRNTHGNLFWV